MAVAQTPLFAAVAPAAALVEALVTYVEALGRGVTATPRGCVEQATGEETFRIEDAAGGRSVCIGRRNRVAVGPGEFVTLECLADDGPLGVAWAEFDADRFTREDGSVDDLRRCAASRYEVPARVGARLSCAF